MFPLKDNIPTRRPAYLTIALIVANAVVYLLQIRGGGTLFGGPSQHTVVNWGVIPYEVTHPGDHCDLVQAQVVCEGQPGVTGQAEAQPATWITVFSSMFMHGSLLHIGGNMLCLWIFGNNVEDAMGHVRFLIFYVLCGVVAVFSQVLPNPGSITPMVGASGAISGVLGAYMLLYPRARVLLGLPVGFLIIQLGRFPALWVLAAWFVLQLVMGSISATEIPGRTEGKIAFGAHIGGFVAGLLLVTFFKRRGVPLWRRH